MSEKELGGHRAGEGGAGLDPHPFDVDTEPTRLPEHGSSPGELLYSASLSRRWWVRSGPNGGYVAAQLLRAMQDAAGARPPRSLSVQFPKAPSEGAAEIAVQTVRSGRSISFLSAAMRQDGETLVTATAAFGETRSTVLEYAGDSARPPADAGEPGELIHVDEGENQAPPVFSNFGFRALGTVPFGGSPGEARTAGWIAPRQPRAVDAALATTLIDVWFPAPFVKLEGPIPAPTLDLSVYFRLPLPLPSASADDPYLIDVTSAQSRDGYFTEDSRLWHAGGTLIAEARQLALM